ncbi:hypothetical protein GA0115254_105847 [Streptomyces sp. Ncost-T10-10d]|nr:hypothetical protein GA0115254_105847 [Streptomyces sp. Ncost-T10-10d]
MPELRLAGPPSEIEGRHVVLNQGSVRNGSAGTEASRI